METIAEKELEEVSETKPVSVYSLSFTPIINDAEREFLIERSKPRQIKKTDRKSSFSKAVFRWRNAAAVAAILAVGVLHFAYQLSVIKTETTQIIESPVISAPVSEPPAVTKPVEFEAKKIDAVLPEKAVPAIKLRQTEVVPPKPQFKKKDSVEPRAARLRRAEKLLTGI
jgi:hypothetical protein